MRGPFQMICFMCNLSDITVFNYDNDTTIACTDVNDGRTNSMLLDKILLVWFERNNLKVNPAKF